MYIYMCLSERRQASAQTSVHICSLAARTPISLREAILRASLTLQETRSIHDSMNIPKIEFVSKMSVE